MPRPRMIAMSTLLVLLAGAAGCSSGRGGSSDAPTPSRPQTPSQAVITWVDSVCSADNDLQVQQAAAGTAALSALVRQGTVQQAAGFIEVVRSSLAGSLTTFEKLHTGVVNGGDRLIDAYSTAISSTLTKIDAVEREANDPTASDPAALAQAAAADLNALAPVGADLPGLVHANPTLRAAYQQATNCKDAKPLTTAGQQPASTTPR